MPRTRDNNNEEQMDVDDEPNPGEVEMDHISDDEEGGIRIGDIYIPPAPKPALTMDGIGPRLIITYIVNENFKSYAGVQVLGPFHKSFSAIIGPNGSGKSNVIDSMLFVFGYRATKIRSKKISVLLHSSSKFPNIQKASVAVHFAKIIDEEGDDYTIVPNSEIVVTRTAFKDNSSYYTLNNKRVQFKEVAKMLRSNGIDLDHNRFLILQGEVEQIAMMKPKAQTEHDSGMLEYLEDIIGTSRYKEPIEKLGVKVEELNEARKDKLNRVKLVEEEKLKYEQPMKEAVALVNETNNMLRCRNMLLQKYIHETNKIIEEKVKHVEEAKNNLKEIDEKLNSIKEKLQEKNSVLKEGMKKYDSLQKQKEEKNEKLQAIKKKLVSVQGDNTQASKKKKNVEQLLVDEKRKLIDLEQIPEKNTREIQDCEKLLTKHKKEKVQTEEELQKLMDGVKAKTAGLRDQKDTLQAKFIELKKIVDEASKTAKVAESELKIYVSSEVSETDKLESLKASLEKAKKALDVNRLNQKEITEKLPTLEATHAESKSRLLSLREEEKKVSQEARSLRNQLETAKASMSANRSRSRVLDSLMKAKQQGLLPGIYGRLGDLGAIDSQYNTAISSACGALDNILVDTLETSQACIEHLKRHDIGRATFIALNRQEHLRAQYSVKNTYPENVPRLFDLIKVKDERVLPAFYFALRETLVVKDLEQAKRIAYGRTRYRTVSLAGQVIEISGTMAGGGAAVRRSGMSSAVQEDTSAQDPRALQADEKRLAGLDTRLSEIRNEQVTLEESVISLEKEIKDKKQALNKAKVEIRNWSEQVPLLEGEVKQQAKKAAACKVDPQKQLQLEKALSSAQSKLADANKNAGEVEKEIHGIDAQISAVATGKVKDVQKKVTELKNKIDKVTTEITKLNVAITTSVRNAKKSKEKINQMETDLEETSKKIEELATQKKQLTAESGTLQKEVEELEEQISEGGGEFGELKAEIGKLQAKENKAKGERLEAGNAVAKAERDVHDCAGKIPVWQRELGTLKLENPGLENVAGVEPHVPLEQHSRQQLDDASVEELRRKLDQLKAKLQDRKPNIQAILDYKAKEELYCKRAAELEEITTRRNEIRDLYFQLKKKRTTDFLAGFSTITAKLKEMYQMITLGGDAELELLDSLDPFTEGIIFSVRPPNKSWKNISNLSGGEKTLSSLALVFALHYYKPTPLYVMDEIDAALDFKNVSIVANYIKERTKNAQFIIISLRYNMFEVSHRLVGIYKTEDCTKSITMENKVPESETPEVNGTFNCEEIQAA